MVAYIIAYYYDITYYMYMYMYDMYMYMYDIDRMLAHVLWSLMSSVVFMLCTDHTTVNKLGVPYLCV